MNKVKTLSNAVLMSVLMSTSVVWGTTAFAADNLQEYSLDTMVVTASRTSEEEFKANANIQVITRKQIEERHFDNISQALRDIPGVFIAHYGSNGEGSISNNLYINGSSNVVVLIDGQRANINGSCGTAGKMALAEISNMEGVEKVEILKSSASTLYGSDAQGGVINIITRKIKDGESKSKITAITGSYDREQYNFSHSGSKDGFYWNISAQKKRTGDYKDGWGRKIVDKLDATNNTYKIGKRFNDNAELFVNYMTYKSDYVITNSGWSAPDITPGTRDNSRFETVYNQKVNNNLENNLSYFRNRNKGQEKDYFKVNDFTTEGFSDQLTYKDGKHTIVSGIDYYRDKVNLYKNKSANTSGVKISNKSFFVQDEWTFNDKWKFTSGLRMDDQSRYGRANTPSFVLGYSPSDKINAYFGYKRFFTAPYIAHLYSAVYGNPDLRAERGTSLEAGMNFIIDDTTTGSLNVFKRDSNDAMAYDATPTATHPKGQYVNIAQEHARGASLRLNKILGNGFSANVGYNYLYIKPDAGKAPNRNGAMPRSNFNLGMNYNSSKFNVDLAGRLTVGKAQNRSKNQTIGKSFRTYWVWDSAVNYKPTKTINIFARVNNIFNRMYTETSYELNPNDKWFSAPGRNFELGVEYSF